MSQYNNVILIDSNVNDVDYLSSVVNSETLAIVYSYSTSRKSILGILQNEFTNGKINRIAICFHGGETRFLQNEPFFAEVFNGSQINNDDQINNDYTDTDNDLEMLNDNTQFIIQTLNQFKVKKIDFISCCSLKYDRWMQYYSTLHYNTLDRVTICASENPIGNYQFGGDWNLTNVFANKNTNKNTNVTVIVVVNENIKYKYFDENIKHYKYLFNTLQYANINFNLVTYLNRQATLEIEFNHEISDLSTEHIIISGATVKSVKNINNYIWTAIIEFPLDVDQSFSIDLSYNNVVSYILPNIISFAINTIVPTINSITITKNKFIIDKINATNNIAQDISNASIQIIFDKSLEETNIDNYLFIRDKNLKPIPSTDIALTSLTTQDGITWNCSMNILQYQLYYYNSEILIKYLKGQHSIIKLDVDTVKTYTYSNKLLGPRNETMIMHYKSCYVIKRIKGKLVYLFDENLQNGSCSIFGINEKNFEDISGSTKVPIGYNSDYTLYNKALTAITTNGIISSGIGSITSNIYNHSISVGFFTLTLPEVAYSEDLLEITEDVLNTWLTMVKKPSESKFQNSEYYLNFKVHITIIVTEFNNSIQEDMTSEITENYGTTFGSMFPKNTKISINKSYIDNKISIANEITNSNHIDSIKTLLKRTVGNILGIGHYWYLPSSPIAYDALNKKYYAGTNGVNKYKELFSSHPAFNNKLFGLPIEDYDANSIFFEEGDDSYSKNITLNGFTHPGLDKEIMTKWIDHGNIKPISIVSLGLLEDIGYDICYNNVEPYEPGVVFSKNYNIHIVSTPTSNIFAKLTDTYIQIKNKYFVRMPLNSSQADLDQIFNDYIATVINNPVSSNINELIVTHNSDIDANWSSFVKNNETINILRNAKNTINYQPNSTRVYKLVTIVHENNSVTAMLDKTLH